MWIELKAVLRIAYSNQTAIKKTVLRNKVLFQHDARVHLLIDSRLGYRNKGDPPGEWKEYASSFANRNLDCHIDEVSKKVIEILVTPKSGLSK